MSGLTDNLDSIAEQIRLGLKAKDAARERALPKCREVIRYCSGAIRAVHRHEFDKAADLLKSAVLIGATSKGMRHAHPPDTVGLSAGGRAQASRVDKGTNIARGGFCGDALLRILELSAFPDAGCEA